MVDLFKEKGWNDPYPSFPDIKLNAPYASLILGNGIPIFNDVDVNGDGGEVITNIFTYDGEFTLTKLWLVILDTTDITTASAVHFDLWDGTNSVVLCANGLDMSGANVHSMAIKNGLDSADLVMLNANEVRYAESAFNRPFIGGVIGHKAATTCYVRLRITTDVNTDITVRIFMGYSPLDFSVVLSAS